MLALGAVSVAGCGGGSSPAPAHGASRTVAVTTRTAAATVPAPPPKPPPPPLRVRPPIHLSRGWRVVAFVHGHPAAWVAQRGGVTLARFDQRLLTLHLHAGSSDGGTEGWRYGDQVAPSEVHHLVAAFNGGFKLTYPNVGFTEAGHVAVALKRGLASIVTYSNGVTDVGAWRAGVPAPGQRVFSVLQNQHLLVDGGAPAPDAAGCITACWGETIGGRTEVARSALGVDGSGDLVWAAGENLLPSQLAEALVGAGAVRAVELDINPDWVAGYLYVHRPAGPEWVQVVPGQLGIAGHLLEPYSRDFFTVVAHG